MSRRTVALLVAAVVAAGAAGFLVRHFSDEARIARSLRAAARAVDEERLLAAASHLSRRYHDPHGLTYESLLGSLADLFATYDDIHLEHHVGSVSVSGTTAVVELDFRLSAEAQGERAVLIGANGRAHATLTVREEDGSWLIEAVTALEGVGARR